MAQLSKLNTVSLSTSHAPPRVINLQEHPFVWSVPSPIHNFSEAFWLIIVVQLPVSTKHLTPFATRIMCRPPHSLLMLKLISVWPPPLQDSTRYLLPASTIALTTLLSLSLDDHHVQENNSTSWFHPCKALKKCDIAFLKSWGLATLILIHPNAFACAAAIVCSGNGGISSMYSNDSLNSPLGIIKIFLPDEKKNLPPRICQIS